MATPPQAVPPAAAPAPTASSADIVAQIQNLQLAAAATDTPQPIGGEFHVGPAAPVGQTVTMTGPGGAEPVQSQLEAGRTIYYEGDENVFANAAVEDIAAMQKALAGVGLLSGKFRIGVWDKPSRGAYTELLAYANASGTTWSDALNRYASSKPSEGPESDTFSPGKFLPKDPAEYRNTVREMFSNVLGRDPDADELARYEAELRQTEQGAFHEAKGGLEEMGGDQMTAAQGAQAFSGELEDERGAAAARFQERFMERVQPEQQFQAAQTSNREQGSLYGSILGTIDEVA